MIFFQFFIKYSIHHPLSADTSFKFLAIILFEIWNSQNFIPLFVKGEIIQGKPEICAGYFSMRNPYMKFQDDILNMNTHTHTDKPKPICPPLFQSWGHKNPNIPNDLAEIVNFHFSHYKSMGTISCHSNQSSYLTGIKNTTYVEANVLSIYAKFWLHPPYGF